jgi:hypothetical protein
VDAKRAVKRELTIVDKPSPKANEFTPVQMAALEMIARGEMMSDIVRRLQYHICGHEPDRKKRLKKTRQRLRMWLSSQKFRDALWDEAVLQLDIDSPRILQGVSRKAQAGRIDAAKLALEITGRHAPNAEVTPAQIHINFGDIPRPQNQLDGRVDLELDPDEVVEVDED